MSKTDKTAPYSVRKSRGELGIHGKWGYPLRSSHDEEGVSPKAARALKADLSRRNRREARQAVRANRDPSPIPTATFRDSRTFVGHVW